ncbi:MAG: DUF1554 domain-containing protein [Leptospiraceae bacterium]|nr:DUF1554 domain-containing protein [Leptospiraceae bacterium]
MKITKLFILVLLLFLFNCLEAGRNNFDSSSSSNLSVLTGIVSIASNSTGSTSAATTPSDSSSGSTSGTTSPTLVVASFPTSILESNTQTFTVKLSSAPSGNITIVLSADSVNVTLSSSSITFSSTNYSVLQNITITISEDTNYYSNYTANITFSSSLGTEVKSFSIIDNSKRMFVTNSSFNGNLGGISGADTRCMGDTNKPSGGSTYKAFLWASSADTRGWPGTDWVLKADYNYRRPSDNALIFKTNSNSNFIETNYSNALDGSAEQVWTGSTTSWSGDTIKQCNDWQSSSASPVVGIVGRIGTGNTTTNTTLSENSVGCDQLRKLICVEQ